MTDSQQVFLRDAMRRLNLTRDALAERLGSKRRALDTWLLPDGSSEFRAMPEMARRFIDDILARPLPVPTLVAPPVAPAGEGAALPPLPPLGPLTHLLSVRQLDREAVEALFALADRMQPIAQRRKVTRVLEGAVLANLFFEASTRTRVSFAAAFCRLGGAVCDTTGFTFSSMAKGESLRDTSRVISGYADAIVVRHPEQGAVAEFARATHVPVVNGGDGPGEHPSQALLDLYTLQREFSRLGKLTDGAHVAFVGDLKYGRTVHSLIQLLALWRGLKFTLVAPPGLALPAPLVEAISRGGHVVEMADSLARGLAGADVVYATRIQKERFTDEALEAGAADFRITRASVAACCRPDVVIMHPLPRDGRPGAHDLATDLDADPRLAIFRQTDNGIPVRMAIFATLLGVGHLVAGSLRDARWQAPQTLGPDDSPFHGLD